MYRRALIPRRLLAARSLLGLDQKELAERAGIARGTLSEIESGQGGNARVDTLVRIAGALRVHPGHLLAGAASECVNCAYGWRVSAVSPMSAGEIQALYAREVTELFERRTCKVCGEMLPPGAWHTQTDCIRNLLQHQSEVQVLAQRFGLTPAMIYAIPDVSRRTPFVRLETAAD